MYERSRNTLHVIGFPFVVGTSKSTLTKRFDVCWPEEEPEEDAEFSILFALDLSANLIESTMEVVRNIEILCKIDVIFLMNRNSYCYRASPIKIIHKFKFLNLNMASFTHDLMVSRIELSLRLS